MIYLLGMMAFHIHVNWQEGNYIMQITCNPHDLEQSGDHLQIQTELHVRRSINATDKASDHNWPQTAISHPLIIHQPTINQPLNIMNYP